MASHQHFYIEWAGADLNHRRLCRQIYREWTKAPRSVLQCSHLGFCRRRHLCNIPCNAVKGYRSGPIPRAPGALVIDSGCRYRHARAATHGRRYDDASTGSSTGGTPIGRSAIAWLTDAGCLGPVLGLADRELLSRCGRKLLHQPAAGEGLHAEVVLG